MKSGGSKTPEHESVRLESQPAVSSLFSSGIAMHQVIDIESDNRHLSRYRGFLVVTEDHAEIGRVPLDDILAIIVHAHGITYSNSLLVELARRGATVVLCAANHHPEAILWPLQGHHAQGARMRAQWEAPKPMLKQLWKHIVRTKIQMQAAALTAYGHSDNALNRLAKTVKSGDPENIEAQAARRYWPLLMGKDFRRDQGLNGPNALLNYGYTVLRAATARAIIGAGLHPTMGLHHSNRSNAFALADDLMEPFRPLVDCAVKGLLARNIDEVTPEAKQTLVRLIAFDLDFGDTRTPLRVSLEKFTHSLAMSFEQGKPALVLPRTPPPLELAALGLE
jgi:CRISPR-associated protein Cas1